MDKQHPFPKTEEELLNWITAGYEEGLTIEYKRGAALSRKDSNRAEISKDVAAMANSAGGVLIYGIAEYPKGGGKDHLPEKVDPVTDPTLTKEWLEQVINSTIHPRILDIEIVPIRVSGPTPGVIFVLKIPQGATAHQSDDRRYYRRFNFMNEPMLDHEIRDIMGRAKHPIVKLSARIRIAEAQAPIPSLQSKEKYRWLKLGLMNEGGKAAHHVRVFVSIPFKLLAFPTKEYFSRTKEIEDQDFAEFVLSNRRAEGEGLMGPSKIDGPLLPGLSLHCKTIALVGTAHSLGEELMFAQIVADDAPHRAEVLRLADLGGSVDE